MLLKRFSVRIEEYKLISLQSVFGTCYTEWPLASQGLSVLGSLHEVCREMMASIVAMILMKSWGHSLGSDHPGRSTK